MRSIVLNRTRQRVPKKFISEWLLSVSSELEKKRITESLKNYELILVLVSSTEMKKLNSKYRGKDYATDVLSFATDDLNVLGELVLCLDVIKKQSVKHGLSIKEELGYMILHGILHLLGYDHELGPVAAKKMFQIQDDVFKNLCKSLKHVSTSRSQRRKKKTRKLT